jgi:hypothetical protein
VEQEEEQSDWTILVRWHAFCYTLVAARRLGAPPHSAGGRFLFCALFAHLPHKSYNPAIFQGRCTDVIQVRSLN